MRTIFSGPRRAAAATTALLGLLLLTIPARADTVRLNNGDVITGTVKKLSGGKLVIKTEYADEISIGAEHISGVSTEEPFTVRWDDGSEKVGRLAIQSGGHIAVVDTATPVDPEAPATDPAATVSKPTKVVDAPTEVPSTPTEVAAPAAPTKESDLEQGVADVEADADAVLADMEPPGEPAEEYLDAKRAAQDATAAAAEYAAEQGEGPVAAESGTVNMAKVDWIKPIQPYYRYEGNFNVGINAARGNTDTTDIHIDGKIVPSFGRNTIALGGEYNKSEADGIVNKSNWTIRAEYDRDFGVHRRWYSSLFNTYENDELANLKLRVTAGAGVGYRFFNQRPTLLRISLGPAYVNEDFRDALDRTFLGLRWNLDFEQDLWSEDLVLYHADTMTFGLSEKQYVLKTTTGIRMDLIADFSVAAEFKYNYNGEPPPNTLKSDQYYIFKIGYAFSGDETDWFPQW